MQAFGVVAADSDTQVPEPHTDTFYLWPECVGTWAIWQRIQTQWRVGMGGREGMDYAGLTAYLRDVLRVKQRDFASTFGEIQVMESAALDEWAKQREKNK